MYDTNPSTSTTFLDAELVCAGPLDVGDGDNGVCDGPFAPVVVVGPVEVVAAVNEIELELKAGNS
eukprot:CAMPEP_0169216878 /NCGR_PEP_ID=MMETSP1016-20121227/18611_1 /TAXON_ID=342587 /ORGANISM="Karlodinium micrum, Strain CCMP2283" /LENGTH=64 /DNA_ID=CAMNT_0009294771 /DNA_START=377 /DNA_END=571 /DNA_ORIENTATION=+